MAAWFPLRGIPLPMKADWHSSPHDPPDPVAVDQTLWESLAGIAEKFPLKTAVIHEGEATIFSALALRVRSLAGQISSAAAPPGPVALLLRAGVDYVAAWFACSIAGRPFILLDHRNPPERNRSLLMRSGAAVLLHDGSTSAMHESLPGLTLVQPGRADFPINADAGLANRAPSLIFPTSGSTGEPKLVVYSAHTLQTKVRASIRLMGPLEGELAVIAGSHANYGFIHHALVFLFSGRGICLLDVGESGLAGILAAIDDHGATNARFTPSLFRVAAAQPSAHPALAKLRAVRFSGEPLLPADLALARTILHPACRIQNVYGSTESSLFIWQDDRVWPVGTATLPIGSVYPSSEIRIVDETGRPVRDGEVGELIISSANHALGDWDRGHLDFRRFPEDPRGGGLRCYHTGDLVRRLPDGNLTLLGRTDRLIKINGQRFSLNELEAHLLAMPDCAQAVVLERPSLKGNRLVAFLTSAGVEGERTDPREWLAGRVPAPVIPSICKWLESMPLLPGGKVDHQKLLASFVDIQPTPRQWAGASMDFTDLAGIWMSVLEVATAAPDMDFPSLGGDSLQFIELRHRVKQRFGRNFPTDHFQARPTLRGLAGLLEISLPSGSSVIDTGGELEIRFELLHRAETPRRGVALGLPGMNGTSYTSVFLKEGIFRSFDVWDCTITNLQGDLLDGKRWVDAALRIAELLRDGTAPRADVLFGYSLAGYIAWLTDRSLAGWPSRPARLVCLDAQPMHHSRKHRTSKHRPFLSASIPPSPGFLQIIRKQPVTFSYGYTRKRGPGWLPSDGPATCMQVSTYEHDDMIKPCVLGRLAAVIDRFAENGVSSLDENGELSDIETPAGTMFSMLCGVCEVNADDLSRLLRHFEEKDSTIASVILQYLAISHGHWEDAIRLLERFVDSDPQKHAPRYALLRMRRMKPFPPAGQAMRQGTCAVLPLQSFAAVDRALAIRRGKPCPVLPAALAHLQDRVTALAMTLPRMATKKCKPLWSRLAGTIKYRRG